MLINDHQLVRSVQTNSRLYQIHFTTDRTLQLKILFTKTILNHLNVKQLFDQFMNENGFSMVFILQFSMIVTITSTSILNNSITFTFINITLTTITNNKNVNISPHSKILVVSITIVIFLFILNAIVIIEPSKSIKQKFQQEELQPAMEKIYKINRIIVMIINNYNNICIVKYNSNPISPVSAGIEEYYNLQQIHLIKIIFYVFEYDINNNELKKQNELEFEFEFENENINCGDFLNASIIVNNEYDCGALSLPTPCLAFVLRPTAFDLNATGTRSSKNNVFQCVFNVNDINNVNNSYDDNIHQHQYTYKQRVSIFTQEAVNIEFLQWQERTYVVVIQHGVLLML